MVRQVAWGACSGADRWGRRGPLNRAQKDAEHLHMLFEDLAARS
jgi:hypothetical protein